MVPLNGRDIYLGEWATEASQAEHGGLVGEWLAGGRCLTLPKSSLTAAESAWACRRFAKSCSRTDGQTPETAERIKKALRVLREGPRSPNRSRA